MPRPRRRSCSRRRAATAPASTARCRRSSARSSSTARPVYVRKEIVHNKHVVERAARARARSSSRPRPRCPRARPSSSPPTASPRASTRTPPSGGCARSTRPARWSPRSTSRPRSSPPRATRSCSSATPATRRSRARWARRPAQSCSSRTRTDVDALEVDDPERIAYISQTTLSVDETRTIIARLRERFPAIVGPRTDDICYATTNRQAAVKQLARAVRPRAGDRLAQLLELQPPGRGRPRARRRLAPDRQRDPGRRGVAARASASWASPPARARPRSSSSALVELLPRPRHRATSGSSRSSHEDVRFMLPKTIRQAMAAPGRLTRPRLRPRASACAPSSSRTCISARAAAAACCAATLCAALLRGARGRRAPGPSRRRDRAAPGTAARRARRGARRPWRRWAPLARSARWCSSPGNHDHRLVEPWLAPPRRRRRRSALDSEVDGGLRRRRSPVVGALAARRRDGAGARSPTPASGCATTSRRPTATTPTATRRCRSSSG